MYLLLIEDNPDLIDNLSEFFEDKRHVVDIAYNGLMGLSLALDNDYDVIVLDVMLPGMDGLEVCSRLRAEGKKTPVIMLTARDTLEDKLTGFAQGSDDYLVKPFEFRELEARILALARRGQAQVTSSQLCVDDLCYDPVSLDITRAGRGIDLPPIAIKILDLLMRRSPAVVSRDTLVREIWGDNLPDSDALRSHIHTLRSAIDREGETPLVHTIRGMGYKIAVTDER